MAVLPSKNWSQRDHARHWLRFALIIMLLTLLVCISGSTHASAVPSSIAISRLKQTGDADADMATQPANTDQLIHASQAPLSQLSTSSSEISPARNSCSGQQLLNNPRIGSP